MRNAVLNSSNNVRKFLPPKLDMSKLKQISKLKTYQGSFDNKSLTSRNKGRAKKSSNSNLIQSFSTMATEPNAFKSTFTQNKISFTDRKKIKVDSEKTGFQKKTLSGFFDQNNDKLSVIVQSVTEGNAVPKEKPETSKRSRNNLNQLMSKTIYDVIPKSVKYNPQFNLHDVLKNKKAVTNRSYSLNEKRYILESTTIIVKKFVPKENNTAKLFKKKKDLSKLMRGLIKMKCVKWLWENKSLLIEKLFLSYSSFKWFLDREKSVLKKKFVEFLKVIKVEEDKDFVDQLVAVFRNEKSSEEAFFFHESLFYLILSSNATIENKVKLMLEVTEDLRKKKVNLEFFFDLCRKVLLNSQDVNTFYSTIRHGLKSDANYCDKEQLAAILLKSYSVKKIFSKFSKAVKEVDHNLDNELANAFNVNLQNVRKNLIFPDIVSYDRYNILNIEKFGGILKKTEEITQTYHHSEESFLKEEKYEVEY